MPSITELIELEQSVESILCMLRQEDSVQAQTKHSSLNTILFSNDTAKTTEEASWNEIFLVDVLISQKKRKFFLYSSTFHLFVKKSSVRKLTVGYTSKDRL